MRLTGTVMAPGSTAAILRAANRGENGQAITVVFPTTPRLNGSTERWGVESIAEQSKHTNYQKKQSRLTDVRRLFNAY